MNLQEYINKECEKFRKEVKYILTPPKPRDVDYHGRVIDWEYKYNKAGLDYIIGKIEEALLTSLTNLAKFQLEEIEGKIEKIKRKPKKHDENRYYTIDEIADFESDSYYQALSQVRAIIKELKNQNKNYANILFKMQRKSRNSPTRRSDH